MRTRSHLVRRRVFIPFVSLSFAPALFAQTDVTWATPSTGNWNLGTNWTGGTIPQNGSPAGVTYNVFIDGAQAGASVVNINSTQHFTIANLTLSPDDQLNVNSGGSLSLAGDGTLATISNGGTISNAGTMNMLAGTVSLTGGGTVTMTAARFVGTGTFSNVNNTIVGSGTFTSGLNNAGLIDATGAMFFDPVGTSVAINSGTIQATAATATLSGNGGPAYTNTGGYILAKNAGTIILVSSVTISGGTLGSEGTGVVVTPVSTNTTVTDITLIGAISTGLNNNFFINGTITNLGTFTSGSTSDLELGGGSVGLLGGGTVILTGASSSLTGAGTLVSNNLIRGQGLVGVNQTAIVNNGTIAADIAATTMAIDVGAGNFANNGLLVAQNGATLSISGNGSGTYSNAGTIQALNGATVGLINGVLIGGGTLTTTGTGVIVLPSGNDATFDSLTNLGHVQGINSNNLFLSGTINNVGSITMSGTSLTDIEAAGGGTVTLTGGGTINMVNVNSRLIGAGTLVNQNNLIHGQGSISVNAIGVINNGTIASSMVGMLHIDPSAAGNFTNNHVLSASVGTLSLSGNGGGTFANSGTIEALNGATVSLVSGALISGGTLTTTGSGVIALPSGNDATFDSLTNLGHVQGINSNNLFLSGTINNVGSITMSGTSLTDIEAAGGGTVTLTGGGTINMVNVNSRLIGAGTLVNQNNLIHGQGSISVNAIGVINNGTIASSMVGMLHIDPSAAGNFTNNHVLSASVGTLSLSGNGGGTFANSGTIEALNGATVSLVSGALISGGTLTTTGSGVIALPSGNDATFDSLTNLGHVQGINSNNVYLSGTINNVGSITMSGGSLTDIEVLVGVTATLTGGGTVNMNNVNSRVLGSGTLINSNNTLRGSGQIGLNALAIVNNGTITADVAATTTTIDPPSVANAFVHNGAYFANAGTSIFTGSGGGAVSGTGSFNVAGGATVSLTAGMQLTGGPVSNNGLLTMSAGTVSVGAITGSGTTTVSAGTVSSSQVLQNTLSLSGSTTRLSVNPNGTSAATSRVETLSITTNARLDLADNALVVDYPVVTPFSTIRGQIITGYAAGAWNGVGINSSSAAANVTTHGLGYAEASDVSISGSFRGQLFTGDAVLVMYTLLGDANLDRTVDSMDFSRLTGAYGLTANANWGQADFDYNGKVNTRDFNHLAGNFGQTLASSLPGAALGAVVPEPAAFALLAMLLPLRRRR